MVMTGATAMMSAGGPNPGMMGTGVGLNQMMDIAGMMGPMGMPMNGDMGMQMQPVAPMMDGRQMGMVEGRAIMGVQEGGPVQGPGGSGTPEQTVPVGMGGPMIGDNFGGGNPAQAMMGMNMGGDFGLQVCLEPVWLACTSAGTES